MKSLVVCWLLSNNTLMLYSCNIRDNSLCYKANGGHLLCRVLVYKLSMVVIRWEVVVLFLSSDTFVYHILLEPTLIILITIKF